MTHVFLTRPPLPRLLEGVRLACVRHAASVYPEPGSNSPFSSLSRIPCGIEVTDVKRSKRNYIGLFSQIMCCCTRIDRNGVLYALCVRIPPPHMCKGGNGTRSSSAFHISIVQSTLDSGLSPASVSDALRHIDHLRIEARFALFRWLV